MAQLTDEVVSKWAGWQIRFKDRTDISGPMHEMVGLIGRAYFNGDTLEIDILTLFDASARRVIEGKMNYTIGHIKNDTICLFGSDGGEVSLGNITVYPPGHKMHIKFDSAQ